MGNLQKIVYLSQAEYETLVTNGTITKGGVTITYSQDDLYITPEPEPNYCGWYTGTAITGTSETAAIFSDSGITYAMVGDMYLNTSTNNTYRCTEEGDAANAKWVYVNNIQGDIGPAGSEYTVLVQTTQPTEESNKLWIPNGNNGVTQQVPTVDEMNTALAGKADTSDIKVQDVQVNGTSILQNGVANVPIANLGGSYGTVKLAAGNGLGLSGANNLMVTTAIDAAIKGGTNSYTPITPYNQEKSAFYGLAKLAGADMASSSNPVGQYTDAAKSAIHEMLNGSVSVSGTTPAITALPGIRYVCGEVATLDITLPTSGIIDVTFTSGSTATVLTITPPTGVTVKWANNFDPTALNVNTTYEINIADGLGVAVGWT